MRDKWTDERLDDLSTKVDRGFDRIEKRIETEIHALRTEMRGEINELRTEMNARFDALSRTMLWFAGALIVAIVASNLGILAAILAS